MRSAIVFRDGNLTIEEVAREEDLVPSYVNSFVLKRLHRITFAVHSTVDVVIVLARE